MLKFLILAAILALFIHLLMKRLGGGPPDDRGPPDPDPKPRLPTDSIDMDDAPRKHEDLDA